LASLGFSPPGRQSSSYDPTNDGVAECHDVTVLDAYDAQGYGSYVARTNSKSYILNGPDAVLVSTLYMMSHIAPLSTQVRIYKSEYLYLGFCSTRLQNITFAAAGERAENEDMPFNYHIRLRNITSALGSVVDISPNHTSDGRPPSLAIFTS